MSGTVSISSNEGVSAMVSDHCRKRISESIHNVPLSNRPGEHRRCPAVDPPLLYRADLFRTLDPQKILHVGAIAPGQGNIHPAPVLRHLVAAWFVTSNTAARKGIILADSGNVPGDSV